MFLNFMLDPRVWKYAAIDLGPLDFSHDECRHRWMVWARNLMGFKPSPYNSVKMYLVAEEILRGDRLDPSNAFQYDHIRLNLPGTAGYNSSLAWISKRRKDGSLATATLAMSLGIPDLNLPMYWGFVFLAFIFCPEPSPPKSGSDPN